MNDLAVFAAIAEERSFTRALKSPAIITVNPKGTLVLDDSELVVEASLAGLGIGAALESSVSAWIEQGRLVQVLKDWCPSFPGFYLYYPSRRNEPAVLSALTEAFRRPG